MPGYREELVGLLIRSLPKDIRRMLIPMTETAAAAYDRLGEPEGRLVDALAAVLRELAGVDGDRRRLRPRAAADATSGCTSSSSTRTVRVVDAGDDLDAIRGRQAGTARSALAAATPISERRDIVTWDIGTLDRVVEQRADGRPRGPRLPDVARSR